MNPIEERDATILDQKKQIESLTAEKVLVDDLNEQIMKISMENDLLKDNNRRFQKKIDFTRRITEQKILEHISHESYEEDPHLVTVLSTTLDEENLEIDEINDDDDSEKSPSKSASEEQHPERSRKGKFLASIEDKLDPTQPMQAK